MLRPAGFRTSLEPLFGAYAATDHHFHGGIDLVFPPDRPARLVAYRSLRDRGRDRRTLNCAIEPSFARGLILLV
jgi:hypothetical protein